MYFPDSENSQKHDNIWISEKSSLWKFLKSVPKEIILWYQKKRALTVARDDFWISVKMRFVRMVVFREQGAHFDSNRLPIWLFPKRGRDRDMAKSEQKTIFCRKHGSDISRRDFQGYHMLRP